MGVSDLPLDQSGQYNKHILNITSQGQIQKVDPFYIQPNLATNSITASYALTASYVANSTQLYVAKLTQRASTAQT